MLYLWKCITIYNAILLMFNWIVFSQKFTSRSWKWPRSGLGLTVGSGIRPLSFFVWLLCCLSFDVRILITPLVSSNSSYQVGTLFIKMLFLLSGPSGLAQMSVWSVHLWSGGSTIVNFNILNIESSSFQTGIISWKI